jgi:FlaA1/EpsC-like NDP-sugar epimerase
MINPTEADSLHTEMASTGGPAELSLVDRQRDPAAPPSFGHLRAVLVGLDLLGALLGWIVVLAATGHGAWLMRTAQALPTAATLSALTVGLLAVQKLYLARVCAVRPVEVARVARSAGVCALAAFGLQQAVGLGPSATEATLGAGSSFLLLVYLRGRYATWLRSCRARGLFSRPVCVLGANEDAAALVRMFDSQPELGYRVVAILGDGTAGTSGSQLSNLGGTSAERCGLREHRAS